MADSIPFSVRPLQPTLVRPFHRDGWVFEEKIDGWRILAYKTGRQVRLVSRTGVDHTGRFRDLATAVAALPDATVILDGEVAVFDERLVSRFDLLSDPDPGVLATPPVYVAFDVLYARGQDLRQRPLAARREMLERIVDGKGSVFAVPRLSTNGHEAWAKVQRRGLEGFVAKDSASRYLTGGPTRSWLKVKLRHDGHFVVGGVVERTEGWSLLLGTVERRRLRYRGLVHWGVGRRLAEALTSNGLVRSTSPFWDRVPLRRVTWLEPRLVAEVSHANMTANGLRAPVFRGVHEPH